MNYNGNKIIESKKNSNNSNKSIDDPKKREYYIKNLDNCKTYFFILLLFDKIYY